MAGEEAQRARRVQRLRLLEVERKAADAVLRRLALGRHRLRWQAAAVRPRRRLRPAVAKAVNTTRLPDATEVVQRERSGLRRSRESLQDLLQRRAPHGRVQGLVEGERRTEQTPSSTTTTTTTISNSSSDSGGTYTPLVRTKSCAVGSAASRTSTQPAG